MLLLFGLVFAALNTGNNLVYVMVSWMIGLLLLSWWLARRMLSSLSFEVELPEKANAMDVSLIQLVITNKRFLPIAGCQVSILLDNRLQSSTQTIPLLEGKGRVSSSIPHVFATRGIATTESLLVSTILPFGLVRVSRRVSASHSTIIFPESEKIMVGQNINGSSARDQGMHLSRVGDFHGIRSYRVGDDPSHIHWKLSAKKDTLVVREHEQSLSRSVVVLLDNGPEARDLELRVRWASYAVRKLLAEGVRVGLSCRDLLVQPQSGEKQKVELLEKLALLGRSEGSLIEPTDSSLLPIEAMEESRAVH